MKISELQELLEKAKEEHGDVEVTMYDVKYDEYYNVEHLTRRETSGEVHVELY